ncbi:methyltransferase type 11 [Thermococcus chitonophagus]|uniref:Methyltransferase type 11 n=1 Tax=Thermococcus chitonophagus TaxID=54262 RepID=A0A2Z2N5D6_9EURY|nr:class I SAM-dependent methyltransferase [Thermococcus chitonophagus]ASJ16744.1 methyltransferase type 11 [Thermococcus chitonophagus]
MAKIKPFEEHRDRYESWFERNKLAYLSELNAVKEVLPEGECVEVGVGTGRFAAPLGIKVGVEPSKKMAEVAEKRGIKVIPGVAEDLPFEDSSLDCILMVTTICFVDDPEKTIREAYRVLKPGGYLIIGFVDKESPIGREYEEKKDKSLFYREARFFSTQELIRLLKKQRFVIDRIVQTLFHRLNEIKEVESVKDGYGEGSFVVIRARKVSQNGTS